jgi:hypothetical protein
LQILNKFYEKIVVTVKENPSACLEKKKDGTVAMKIDVAREMYNSLSEEELAVMKKYEIE